MNPANLALRRIIDSISNQSLPPVNDWHPQLCRDVDIRIARNGDWFYEGSLIHRPRMVKLFSSVLRVDDDDETFLVTPNEKLRIRVDDAPFLAISVERHGAPLEPALVFTTNVGDQVVADAEHPIQVEYKEVGGEPAPYVVVRDKLRALLSRSVFYQLADWADEREGHIEVESSGVFMRLSEPDSSV